MKGTCLDLVSRMADIHRECRCFWYDSSGDSHCKSRNHETMWTTRSQTGNPSASCQSSGHWVLHTLKLLPYGKTLLSSGEQVSRSALHWVRQGSLLGWTPRSIMHKALFTYKWSVCITFIKHRSLCPKAAHVKRAWKFLKACNFYNKCM